MREVILGGMNFIFVESFVEILSSRAVIDYGSLL